MLEAGLESRRGDRPLPLPEALAVGDDLGYPIS